ncbi:MAG: alpha/beta fold hydrolase [Saprospiraceae bacterium]
MKTPPLILLHGALGAADQMQALQTALAPDFQTFTFSFSGHGGLPLPDAPLSIGLFADDLLRFMDAENLPQADVFGYSMGGYVALEFARRHPARLRRIATLGTKFGWSPDIAAREAAMLNPEKWEAKVPQFAQMLAARHAPTDWKTLTQRTAEMMLALGNGAALTGAQLADIQQPVQIMVGELDNMVSREESEWAAGNLPGGSFECLPGVKHPFEQVDVGMLAERMRVFFEWAAAKTSRFLHR